MGSLRKVIKLILSQPSVGKRCQSTFIPIKAEEFKLSGLAILRGRKYLPGADQATFPEHLQNPRQGFPHALKFVAKKHYTIDDCAKACRKYIQHLLPKYKAILFRNLPLFNAEEIRSFIVGTAFTRMNYIGGNAFREKVEQDLYSASDEPPEVSMDLHNEMAYLESYPRKIFFICLTPPLPGHGGETPICDNREIYRQLDNHFLKKIEEKKIRYIRNCSDESISSYMSWQAIFGTKSKQDIERKLLQGNYQWEWKQDNGLRYWYVRPGFINHPESGERLFFNQLHANHASYYKKHPQYMDLDISDDEYILHSTYGDGEEFEPELIQKIREIGYANAVGFQWQKGDVLVLDNLIVQHGRMSFTNTERKLLVGLSSD